MLSTMDALLGEAGFDRPASSGRVPASDLPEDVTPWEELETWDLAPVKPAFRGYTEWPVDEWSFYVPRWPTSDQQAEKREQAVTRMGLLRRLQETVAEPPAEEPSPPVEPAEPAEPAPLRAPRPPDRTPQIKPQPIRRPSRWRGPNRFAQACVHCRQVVPVRAGIYRDVPGGWEAAHDETGVACWTV